MSSSAFLKKIEANLCYDILTQIFYTHSQLKKGEENYYAPDKTLHAETLAPADIHPILEVVEMKSYYAGADEYTFAEFYFAFGEDDPDGEGALANLYDNGNPNFLADDRAGVFSGRRGADEWARARAIRWEA